jgi:SAM-dependent methyltransferase
MSGTGLAQAKSSSVRGNFTRRILQDVFRCPYCGGTLEFAVDASAVRCTAGHIFEYRDGVVDFARTARSDAIQERSTESFGEEWTSYYSTLGWSAKEFATEKEMFLTYTRAMPNFFAGKTVLDAGCGNGRYIHIVNRIASPPPRLVIAVDISESIFVAARNCAQLKNVVFVKIDLNLLPAVLRQPVDYVYSIGVLHHTPDAHRSFSSLAKCVGPNGFFSVFLYGRGNPLLFRINNFLRNRLFHGWPRRAIYGLCVVTAIPAQVFRIKLIGSWLSDLVNRVVFVSADVHNMFDAYTAGWTSFHDKQTVAQWYAENGMESVIDSQLNHTSLYCIGRRIDNSSQ